MRTIGPLLVCLAALVIPSTKGCLAARALDDAARWSGHIQLEIGLDAKRGSTADLEGAWHLSAATGWIGAQSHLPGDLVWEEVGAVARLGGLALKGSLLLGPCGGSLLFGELVLAGDIAGWATEWHLARLSQDVLGGPAGGWALRLAGRIGRLGVVATSEFGAGLADPGSAALTLVHTPTGLARSYVIDPLPAVSAGTTGIRLPLTGQRISVTGWTPDWAERTEATLYLAGCGESSLSLALRGIDLGADWLSSDITLLVRRASAALALTSALGRAEGPWVTVLAASLRGETLGEIVGLAICAVEARANVGSTSVRGAVLLDPARYAVTAPGSRAVVEEITCAVKAGPALLSDCRAFLSIEVPGPTCLGDGPVFSATLYAGPASSSVLGWKRFHLQGYVSLSNLVGAGVAMDLVPEGVDGLSVRLDVLW